MDLEKLKCCAEALGLSPMVTTEGVYVNYFHDLGTKKYGVLNQEFDPEHNDAQMAELLKHLIDNYERVEITLSQDKSVSIDLQQGRWYTGQTLNQAVIEAVWEVKK